MNKPDQENNNNDNRKTTSNDNNKPPYNPRIVEKPQPQHDTRSADHKFSDRRYPNKTR